MGTPTTTADPATGAMTPAVPPGCGCDLTDASCSCDASGACKGRQCVGQCVPPKPTCDPAKPPVACPAIARVCPNGQPPMEVGYDPNTCCPITNCPVCARATDPAGATTSCAAPECRCAKQVGTDPMSCCPTYECYPVLADGTCGRG
jgi:hypothetical protein